MVYIMPNKTQMGPRVEDSLVDDYRDFVRFVNNGTYKGRLGDEVEEALKIQMGLYFIQNPAEIERAKDSEFVENDEFVEEVIKYIDMVGPEILEAARNLGGAETQSTFSPPRDTPHQLSNNQIPASERLMRSQGISTDDDEVLRRVERLEAMIQEFVEEGNETL